MILGVEMDVDHCFSPDYRTAREKFRAAAREAGGLGAIYLNPNRGPFGEELATDTAWFGPEDAGRVLVLNSATHGVEGFCGSGALIDWLSVGGPKALPADTAVLLVHALNPHGFAWLRRVTEEGVDLNRNCVDFTAPLPENPGYAEIADLVVPMEITGPVYEAAQAALAAKEAEIGRAALTDIRSRGQYTHPTGLFYGGTRPTWARRTLERLSAEYALDKRLGVAVIDYHTGLGPFGHAEPICGHRPGESGQARCRAWYGDSLGEPLLGKSSSPPMTGLTQYGWARAIGAERLTFIALEYGTYDATASKTAMESEAWLHAHGQFDWSDPESQRIQHLLRKYFYPDTRDWKELVLFRSRQVISQALAGLTAL